MDLTVGVVITVLLAGFRHGFDIDHIAAIGDITGSQITLRRGFVLASLYATGHAVVLFLLGLLAISAGRYIPEGVDDAMSRVIGASLVALGLYVVFSLIRYRKIVRMKSRWMLLIAGVRKTLARLQRRRPVRIVHEHEHGHDGLHEHHPPAVSVPPGSPPGASSVALRTETHTHLHTHVAAGDPFESYSGPTSFGVGVLHGVGAETPSQILLLTTAAGVAGTGSGVLLLFAFVIGLFAGNSVLALVAGFGFDRGRSMALVYTVIAGATAALSLYVGALYLFGRADLLPGFLGG